MVSKTDAISDLKISFKILFQSTLGIFLGKIQEQLTKIDEKKNKNKNNFYFDFLIPNHLKRKINSFLKISINSAKNESNLLNNHLFRESMPIYNKVKNTLYLNNVSDSSFQENEIKNNNDDKKNTLEEIKEIRETKKLNNKKIKEKNKENKEKKFKIPIRKNKSKISETIIVKDTKQVFDKIMNKKFKIENSNKKDNYLVSSKNINNTEINNNKLDDDDGFDDININEFNLEDDEPINISINNITKTFCSTNYISTESNQEKKLNLSSYD